MKEYEKKMREYSKKSKDELEAELKKEVSSSPVSDKEFDDFARKISPMLTEEQKKRLAQLGKMIKGQ